MAAIEASPIEEYDRHLRGGSGQNVAQLIDVEDLRGTMSSFSLASITIFSHLKPDDEGR